MISFYFYHPETGQVMCAGKCMGHDYDLQTHPIGIKAQGDSDPRTQYVEGGALKTIPPQPSLSHVWNWNTKEWLPDADVLRASHKHAWNQWRDTTLVSGYAHDGHTFHSDDTFLGELQLLLKGYERGFLTGTSSIRTLENEVLQMNEQEVEGLLLMSVYRQGVYSQSWVGKDALEDPDLTYEQLLTMGPPQL